MVKIVESFKTQQVNLQQQNDENDENDDTLAAPACVSIMTGDDWDQDVDGHRKI